MSSSSPTGTTAPLTFEQFWRWLLAHRNCLVRVEAGDAVLFDHETLHWDFFDEPDGRAVCQLIAGKLLVGEVVIERADVVFVQATPDVEEPQRGHWAFECMGPQAEDGYPAYSFVLSHGMETTQGHQTLKH